VFNSDLKVGVAKRRGYVYPDATVVCSTPEYGEDEGVVLLNPLLIVEVLSPSTERFDRMGRFLRYQHIPSFAEYLLIAQDAPCVELCSRQDDGYWEWLSVEGVESAIVIPSLDCTIALADIYRNISFDQA
jgi:Uma2 family endonuclease